MDVQLIDRDRCNRPVITSRAMMREPVVIRAGAFMSW